MGSWFDCPCGGRIHTNLFAGTNIYKLIKDADFDAVQDPVDRGKLSTLFFTNGVTAYRCKQCGRLIVEWEEGDLTFYRPDGMRTEFQTKCKNNA